LKSQLNVTVDSEENIHHRTRIHRGRILEPSGSESVTRQN
jgi:hypothetical protein